jgi:hypothetical protein
VQGGRPCTKTGWWPWSSFSEWRPWTIMEKLKATMKRWPQRMMMTMDDDKNKIRTGNSYCFGIGQTSPTLCKQCGQKSRNNDCIRPSAVQVQTWFATRFFSPKFRSKNER